MKTEYQNRLPHIAPIGATFFVTFCLYDALPQLLVNSLKEELNVAIKQLEEVEVSEEVKKKEIEKLKKSYFGKFDNLLDGKKYGECYLERADIAEIMTDKILEYNGLYYDLLAYCIMPNHVHLLMDFSIQLQNHQEIPLSELITKHYKQLDEVMQLIKGGSSRAINVELNRTGRLWHKDSYDHYARNQPEIERIMKYIAENPVKAGLVERLEDWKYLYFKV